jgi:hypothetical protein
LELKISIEEKKWVNIENIETFKNSQSVMILVAQVRLGQLTDS